MEVQLSPLSQLIPSFDSPTLADGFDNVVAHEGQVVRGSGRQYVRFYEKTFKEVRTKEAEVNPKTGAVKVLKQEVVPVTKLMVQIETPGDKNKVDDVATEWHKREFGKQYLAFRKGATIPLGKDLDECDYVSSSIALELKYQNCHTEEQLADASDDLVNLIPDGWQLREFARAMCEDSLRNGAGRIKQLESELSKSSLAMVEMQQQLEEMRSLLVDKNGKPLKARQPKTVENEQGGE